MCCFSKSIATLLWPSGFDHASHTRERMEDRNFSIDISYLSFFFFFAKIVTGVKAIFRGLNFVCLIFWGGNLNYSFIHCFVWCAKINLNVNFLFDLPRAVAVTATMQACVNSNFCNLTTCQTNEMERIFDVFVRPYLNLDVWDVYFQLHHSRIVFGIRVPPHAGLLFYGGLNFITFRFWPPGRPWPPIG